MKKKSAENNLLITIEKPRVLYYLQDEAILYI